MLKKWLIALLFLPICLLAKVYDCFPFFNELELLKIRLSELDPVVDRFVLVESIETQRGKLKPLYFEENKELFAPYLHKIIHVAIRERHPEFTLWERENFQRNCILRGLQNCKKKDLVMISDLDEIPNSGLVAHAKCLIRKFDYQAVSFHMRLMRFHLNRLDPIDYWVGTVMTSYGLVEEKSPQYFRNSNVKFHTLQNAGWHFTWLGGVDKIRQKFESVVEGTDSTEKMSDESIEAMIQTVPAIPIDESFPRYILDHQEELEAKGFLVPTT